MEFLPLQSSLYYFFFFLLAFLYYYSKVTLRSFLQKSAKSSNCYLGSAAVLTNTALALSHLWVTAANYGCYPYNSAVRMDAGTSWCCCFSPKTPSGHSQCRTDKSSQSYTGETLCTTDWVWNKWGHSSTSRALLGEQDQAASCFTTTGEMKSEDTLDETGRG